jgi:hypothetical protein
MIKQLLVIMLLMSNLNLFGFNITLTYRISKDARHTQPAGDNSGNKNNQSERSETIGKFFLFDNGFLVVQDTLSGKKTIYDFYSEKITTIKSTTYDIVPLFSSINYRETEFQNRKYLSGTLMAGVINDVFGGTFGLEVLFVIEDKPGKLKSDIKENKSNSLVEYYYKTDKVASVEYSQKKLDGKYKGIFNKFLIYNTNIHPVIINAITQYGFIPKTIEYKYTDAATQTTVKFELAETSDKEQSLENLMTIKGLSQDSVNCDSLELLVDKVYNKVSNENAILINKDRCIVTSRDLIKQSKYFDALLTLFEYFLQSGEQPSDAIKSTMTYQNKDKDMKIFVDAINTENTKEALEKSIRKLESINQNSYEKGYLINIFLANFYTNIGFNKSLPFFQKAIIKNQYITSVYKDLGDFYANNNNMDYAWKCYDIVLLINKNHPMSKEIETTKSKFRKKYPDYFRIKNDLN